MSDRKKLAESPVFALGLVALVWVVICGLAQAAAEVWGAS